MIERMRTKSYEVIVAVAALLLNAWALSQNGYGNDYYAAAARSMTTSWRNFFFGSFDPGGWITVDKPPLALWAQAGSARLFGFSSWSLLLPSAIAGAVAVWLLMTTVRRVWGRTAGLCAGIVLMLTPAMFAVSRSNNPDVFLVLAAVGAGWATERAIATGKLRWMLAVGACCGVGFLAKLLVIGLVMPGLWLAYLVAAQSRLRTRIVHCIAAFGAFVAVAAIWVIPVQITSLTSRPYIGSSIDGSAVDLVFGYNGLGRITGTSGPSGGFGGGGGPGGPGRQGGGPGGFGGGSGINQFGGATGIGRLFNSGMGDQIMWLAPLVAVTILAASVIAVRRRSRDARLGSLVMFAVWAVVSYLLFAFAKGIYHNYYVALLAPALAALVGIGVQLVRESRVAGRLVAAAGMAGTAWLAVILERRVDAYTWLRWLVPVLIGGAGVALVATAKYPWRPRAHRRLLLGSLVSCCLAPAVWVLGGSQAAQIGAFPDARPATAADTAGPFGRGGPPGGGGFGELGSLDAKALTWLRSQQTTEDWIYATGSSMQASGAIIAGDSVMAMGGFSGSDPAMTSSRLADLVRAGRLRFVQAGGGFAGFGGGGGGGGGVTASVTAACAPVSASSWGGSASTATGLYDCRGKTDAIRATSPTSAAPPTMPGSPGGGIDIAQISACMAERGFSIPAGGAPPAQLDPATQAALQECFQAAAAPAIG